LKFLYCVKQTALRSWFDPGMFAKIECNRIYALYINEKEGHSFRAAFIIDPEGILQTFFINPQPVGRNISDILRIIEALQFIDETGLRVPAGWQPGDPGIKADWELVGKY
ncbi:MAG: hypothetical protein ACM3TR_18970, partial [Caulobacteraceae bacterium]